MRLKTQSSGEAIVSTKNYELTVQRGLKAASAYRKTPERQLPLGSMREGIKIALGVIGLIFGAAAPTLILETAFFPSLHQTQQPRYRQISEAAQKEYDASKQHDTSARPSPPANAVGTIEPKRDADTGAQNGQNDHSITEPSWVSYAQGGGAIASGVFAAFLTVVGFLQWRTYKTQTRIMRAQSLTTARATRAAQRSVRVAERTLTLERPYVFVTGIEWGISKEAATGSSFRMSSIPS